MMRASERGVGKTRAGPHNNYRLVVVTNIDSDLFNTTVGHKVSYSVTNRPQPGHGHPRGHANHVRFGYAAVMKASRAFGLKVIEKTVANIRREQNDPLVLDGQLRDFVGESVPHGRPSSCRAALTSSALGTR
jgi:hypothetical protein